MRPPPMACQKLSYIIPDLHPRLTQLLPSFPPSHQDPLPCPTFPQSFLLSPSPYSPFVRKAFEDAVCAHVPVPDQELESADNSTESSVSSFSMSSNSDDDENDTGSSSTSSLSSSAHVEGPLDNLTSLCAALPIKRGLSRYFSGKSQSFSSLARVSSVADLAKPENPYVKRRRTGIGADSLLKHHSYPPRCAGISKRPTTSNRYKTLKSLPRPQDAIIDGKNEPKPRPSKCFSVPEF